MNTRAEQLPRNADSFAELARYYDPLMLHVDYAHWQRVASGLADFLPRPLRHLDAACGTGVLLDAVGPYGWHGVGVDLSPAMLVAARSRDRHHPYAVADLCALPFVEAFDLVTCLFDSVNFLLTEQDVSQAIAEMARALLPGGILYFDIITERMVIEYFEGRTWAENNGRFDSTWTSTYDRSTRLSTTIVRIDSGAEGTILERVYGLDFVRQAVADAGLELVAAMDSETFGAPGRKTTRIDIVAAKEPGEQVFRHWRRLQRMLRAG